MEMDQDTSKTDVAKGISSSATDSNITGDSKAVEAVGTPGRGSKRVLDSPGETGRGKTTDLRPTPEGKGLNLLDGLIGLDSQARSFLEQVHGGDAGGTFVPGSPKPSETDSIKSAAVRIQNCKIVSETGSVDENDPLGENIVDVLGDEQLSSSDYANALKSSVQPPTKKQRVSTRPSFPFQVIAYQVGHDDGPSHMSKGIYTRLDDLLADRMYSFIMEGPTFSLAMGAKNLINGKMVIGCSNQDTMVWLQNQIKNAVFEDGVRFDIWSPSFKGVKMSFFAKKKDKLSKRDIMTLLTKQNFLSGKWFSIYRITDIVNRDVTTGASVEGFNVIVDVSKELRDEVMAKGKMLNLLSQVIHVSFPEKSTQTTTSGTVPRKVPNVIKKTISTTKKSSIPRPSDNPDYLPPVEEFWNMTEGARRFFRRRASTLGKPFDDKPPVGFVKKIGLGTKSAGSSTAVANAKPSGSNPGAAPSGSTSVEQGAESAGTSPKEMSGEDYRKSKEEARRKANLAKGKASGKPKNPKFRKPEGGQTNIKQFF
jgi:hypothetical protein